MGELEQILAALAGIFGGSTGSPPVPGLPASVTPNATTQLGTLAGAGFPGAQAMTGVPSAPGSPGGAGTPGSPGLLSTLVSSGLNLQQILQIISALGGANLGTDEINQLKQLYAQQQRAASIAMNPAALARRAARATLPLNKELAYTVTNAADAATANRGMAQAPGAVASGEAAALAPYAQQNLRMGANFAEFGLPTGGFGTPNVPDYMSVLAELNNFGRGTGGGAYSLPAGTF